MMKQLKKSVKSSGRKVSSLEVAQVHFDFDELSNNVISDTARQILTKKKHIPKKIIGIITLAQRVCLSKDKDDDKKEIVVDVLYVLELNEKEEFFRNPESIKVDYLGNTLRFALPRRMQKALENLENPSLLIGSFLVVPNFNLERWGKKKSKT